jgi:exopolysaccharide biosynthesis polyprenyl glycosylphosphotransferase
MLAVATGRDWAKVYWRLLPLLDFLLVLVAFRAAHIIRYDIQWLRPVDETFYTPFSTFFSYALFFALWLVATLPVAGLYREQRGRSWLEEAYRIAGGATTAAVIVMALSFLLQPPGFSRLVILFSVALTVFLLALNRTVYRVVRQRWRKRGLGVERVLIVGAGSVGRAVLSAIIARPDLGYVPVGYLDDNPDRGLVNMGRVRGLGVVDNLDGILARREADLVIITLPWDARPKITALVALCASYSMPVRIVPDLFQISMNSVRIETLEGVPLLAVNAEPRINRAGSFSKRLIDMAIVVLASPLVLLLAAVIMIAIRLDSAGPVLYRQKRVGKDGRLFYMYKFRSMVKDADKLAKAMIEQTGVDPKRPKWENDPRITRVGYWLRRTSVDELPNLINVVRGEMSIVGPRPPLPSEVEYYEAWQRQRLNTLPGLTGLWQVSGRSKIPFEEQCLLDIYYIENWSIGLDIQILLRTVPNVLLGNGAY